MAEHNFKKISSIRAYIGGSDKDMQLYKIFNYSLPNVKSIDIIVSFLMESGVRLLLNDFKKVINRDAKIRVITGNYLNITQPSALFLIKKEFGDQVELKFYNDHTCSFHPKAYFMHFEDHDAVFVGSSNLSKSALTSGIEWNYLLSTKVDEESYKVFYNEFENIYKNSSIFVDDKVLYEYSKNWKRPVITREFEKYNDGCEEDIDLQPRGIQIEALYALEKERIQGKDKALLVIATGVGKTYISAFDSGNFKRILFIAHHEEILKQAAQSFRNIRKSNDIGFFSGKKKDTENEMIFASVASLGKKKYLNKAYFSKDDFDYIIIDEFHHAVSDYYQNIIEYFKPKFLLGLTATPERLDRKNIYDICDYNVPYELTLKDAINKGMLVPFHYYGVYDETDYSHISEKRTEKELNRLYKHNLKRQDLIYKHYKKHKTKQALGFCCSKEHADEMAKMFTERGVKAVSVYSGYKNEISCLEDRNAAIQKLQNGEIKVIFSVDMFNEGVDIPTLDMVMFLRPTESPTVFLQQLGRGLRKSKEKDHLTVLDFIGNYMKSYQSLYLLSSQNSLDKKIEFSTLHDFEYPDDCIVNFDMKLIDLFQRMDESSISLIQNEFYHVKSSLHNSCPTRVELYMNMENTIYQLCLKNSAINPFRDYLGFLNSLNELNDKDKVMYHTKAKKFLNFVESTRMTKVYKMLVFLTFYNEGIPKKEVTLNDILIVWKNFFSEGEHWKDLANCKSYADFIIKTDKRHLNLIKDNPVRNLVKHSSEFIVSKDEETIMISDDYSDYLENEAFIRHFKDIIDYRIMSYYIRKYKGFV